MMAVQGRPKLDLQAGQVAGVRYPVFWVDIDNPDRAHSAAGQRDNMGVYQQGLDRGGAIFSRLEGAWYGDGRIWITSTDGGAARMGQVWELDLKASEIRTCPTTSRSARAAGWCSARTAPRIRACTA
jgi:hypothetical protein